MAIMGSEGVLYVNGKCIGTVTEFEVEECLFSHRSDMRFTVHETNSYKTEREKKLEKELVDTRVEIQTLKQEVKKRAVDQAYAEEESKRLKKELNLMNIGGGRLRSTEEMQSERIKRLEKQLVEYRLEIEKKNEQIRHMKKTRPTSVEFARRGCYPHDVWMDGTREVFFEGLDQGWDLTIKCESGEQFVIRTPQVVEYNKEEGRVL